MKTIKNKTTEIEGDFEDEKNAGKLIHRKATYADLMKIAMNQIPQQGISTAQMRKDFRVFDALEKANHKIELEESDFEYLHGKIKGMSWGFRNRGLILFEDDMELVAKGEADDQPKNTKNKK